MQKHKEGLFSRHAGEIWLGAHTEKIKNWELLLDEATSMLGHTACTFHKRLCPRIMRVLDLAAFQRGRKTTRGFLPPSEIH
jgi:hypothetical protein